MTTTPPPGAELEKIKRECYGDSPIACRASIDRAIDHLAARNMLAGGWMPIDSAPRDGTRILCWSNELYIKPYIAWWGEDQNKPDDGNEHFEWLSGDGDDWSTGYYYTPVNPTHFMPLPPPPVDGGV